MGNGVSHKSRLHTPLHPLTMDDCAVVATTPSATLTALQARREAREQRQAGLFKRLSNLRSLKAQLFDIKQKHEGVVLTGGDDIFQNEVNSLVAEIDKLKAEREHETLTVEPRPLPPWLLVPGLASAPVRGVDDDFLNRLQQAEKRDAAAAADIAAISLAVSEPPPLRKGGSLSRLGGFMGNAARTVSGRLSRASMRLSTRLSRKSMDGAPESWRSEGSEREPSSPSARSPTRLPRLTWADRAPAPLEGSDANEVARQQARAMRQVVAAQSAKPSALTNPATAEAVAAAAVAAAAQSDASSAAKLAAARSARSSARNATTKAKAKPSNGSAAAKPRWGVPTGNGTAKPTKKAARWSGRMAERMSARLSRGRRADRQDTCSLPSSPEVSARQVARLPSRSAPASPTASSADVRRGSAPPRLAAAAAAAAAAATSAAGGAPNGAAGATWARSKGRRGSADPLSSFGLQTVGPIAAGAFSMIVRATDAAGTTVAVKTFNKAKCAKDAGLATASAGELRVLRMLAPDAHDHLANLMHVHESLQSVHLVLEYCAGGSLQRRLQALQRKGPTGHSVGVPEAEAALMSRQLCSALAHMHTRGVAHRDVKPSNVLFVDGTNVSGGSVGGGGAGATRLKLCDFGFATFRPPPARCHTRCGTPIYMAPELHVTNAAGAGGKDGYLPAPVDCWALGALVFELLHAKPAFIAETMPELVRRVRNANHAPFAAALSSEAKDLIKALLTIKPAARCEAEQALEHAWLAASS